MFLAVGDDPCCQHLTDPWESNELVHGCGIQVDLLWGVEEGGDEDTHSGELDRLDGCNTGGAQREEEGEAACHEPGSNEDDQSSLLCSGEIHANSSLIVSIPASSRAMRISSGRRS